ncbi:MAG TPA: hypothetical protein VGJ37_03225 [Pyrinomonadaceae bacterium]|jgi:hypothetical protein
MKRSIGALMLDKKRDNTIIALSAHKTAHWRLTAQMVLRVTKHALLTLTTVRG